MAIEVPHRVWLPRAFAGLVTLALALISPWSWIVVAFVLAYNLPLHNGAELPCGSCRFFSLLLHLCVAALLLLWNRRVWKSSG